jgi:hypothetical protein
VGRLRFFGGIVPPFYGAVDGKNNSIGKSRLKMKFKRSAFFNEGL